jgi:hypothetical protein
MGEAWVISLESLARSWVIFCCRESRIIKKTQVQVWLVTHFTRIVKFHLPPETVSNIVVAHVLKDETIKENPASNDLYPQKYRMIFL